MRKSVVGETKQRGEQATVRTIAARLGLSPATVSLALNGQRPTSYVSVATRRQVWETAETMGYPLAKLRSRRPPIERAAVFTNRSRGNVYSESLLELCRVLNQRRVQVLTHSHESEMESLEAARELFRRQDIDAAVFVGSRPNGGEPITSDLIDGLPSVFIGELPAESRVWQVCPDNEGGGRIAGEHLWGLGHRAVSMVYPLTDSLVAMKRLRGLRAVWEENGLVVPDASLLRVHAGKEEQIREVINGLVAANAGAESPVTALFCFNDWIAGSVMKALRHASIRVPEDISVVGFDNEVYCNLMDPPLTTIHQAFDSLGNMAAEMLLTQAESPSMTAAVQTVPCHLVERQSTAVARI